MSHEITHVVISLSTPVEVAKVKTKAGYCGLVLVVVGFLVGLIF